MSFFSKIVDKVSRVVRRVAGIRIRVVIPPPIPPKDEPPEQPPPEPPEQPPPEPPEPPPQPPEPEGPGGGEPATKRYRLSMHMSGLSEGRNDKGDSGELTAIVEADSAMTAAEVLSEYEYGMKSIMDDIVSEVTQGALDTGVYEVIGIQEVDDSYPLGWEAQFRGRTWDGESL